MVVTSRIAPEPEHLSAWLLFATNRLFANSNQSTPTRIRKDELAFNFLGQLLQDVAVNARQLPRMAAPSPYSLELIAALQLLAL